MESSARPRLSLAESEALYRGLVEDQSDLVSLATPEGELTFVNFAYARLHDAQPADMVGKSLFDFVPEKDRTNVCDHLQMVCRLKHGVEDVNQVILPNGHRRWIAWTNRALRDRNGQVTAIHSVGRDIGWRIAAEQRLKESEARYRLLAENATDLILLVTREGKRLYASPSCFALLGYQPDEMLQIATKDALHPEDVEMVRELLANSQKEREILRYRMRRRDGGYVWVESVARPLAEESGQPPRWLFVARNIDQRIAAEREQIRLTEAAERANRAKSEFLSHMSHEIRTPMNGVVGMNALLLETDLTAHQRKLSETVRDSADALLSILNDILDVSKLEADRVDLEEIEFDLPTLVEKTAELLDPRARQKGLSLTLDIAATARSAFYGDPMRLRQILLNLASNAIKFTERGGVEIFARGSDTDADHACLRIEVHDTGIGISDADKSRLFSPFVQADASITRRFGGTGLGLSICKKLVELMDGQIGIADRPGGGSVFWFEVHLRYASPARATEGELRDALASDLVAPVSGHVLLAEDDTINVEVARLILEGAGYTVDVALDGREAVAAALRCDYDLILMDMQMPGLDGLSATQEIRATERRGRRVPIVAMTANAMQGDQRRCLEAGMDDYVSKPIAPAKLRETITRWLDASRVATVESPPIAASAAEPPPVIDRDVVASLRSYMAEAKFAALVTAYLAQTDARSQRFERWRTTLALDEIGDEAHKIVSLAGAFGARQVQELAARLQAACRSGDKASAPELIDQLRLASAAASTALRQMLAA
jgi:PAS domain S-box-containing protein